MNIVLSESHVILLGMLLVILCSMLLVQRVDFSPITSALRNAMVERGPLTLQAVLSLIEMAALLE